MAFLSDIFGRMGRVARGQANAGVDERGRLSDREVRLSRLSSAGSA